MDAPIAADVGRAARVDYRAGGARPPGHFTAAATAARPSGCSQADKADGVLRQTSPLFVWGVGIPPGAPTPTFSGRRPGMDGRKICPWLVEAAELVFACLVWLLWILFLGLLLCPYLG